jgi:hypothetical protein
MTNAEEKIIALFEELVPFKGKADTVAGEMVRAISRIGYRYNNDGDCIGIEYGNKTCNAAARYLQSIGDENINETIDLMWGNYREQEYLTYIQILIEEVAEFIEEHPELKTTPNEIDMNDFARPEDEDSWDDGWGDEDEEDEWAEDWDEEE